MNVPLKLSRIPTAAAVLSVVTVAAACGESTTTPPAPEPNIVEVAEQAGSFQTLLAAAEAAGLAETLASEELTVFAPTDEAFAALPDGVVEYLLDNPELLAEVLTYHVVAGRVTAAQVAGVSSVETLNGQSVAVATEGSTVRIGTATVVQADIEASNGIIHVIDDVLTPLVDLVTTARLNGNFTTLLAALEAAGLDEVLRGMEGEYTIFAPTDAAFAEIPQDDLDALLADSDALTAVLLYHAASGTIPASEVVTRSSIETLQGGSLSVSVNGDVVTVGSATVVATDVAASNGVIHVIDGVLIP